MWAACSGHLFLSVHANTGHLIPSIPANSGQCWEAACHQLAHVLERLLSSLPSPSRRGDAQRRHSATKPLFMSSTAQKACVNTSEGEHQVVTSNSLVATQLYLSPKHSRARDVAELLLHNTPKQYPREILQITSHGDAPLIKKYGPLYPCKVTPWCRGEWRSQGDKAAVARHIPKEEWRGPLHWLKPKTKVPPTESRVSVSSREGF